MTTETVQIETAYDAYTPLVDYVTLIKGMLAFVPPACLDGIERIELRAGSSGNRAYRRKKSRSRGQKHLRQESLGLYYPRRQTCAAYIVVHVDNHDKHRDNFPRIPFLKRFACESRVAETLYHEIGHHIHLAKQRTYRNEENVADDWANFYTRRYVRSRFWWLRVVLFPYFMMYSLIERLFLRDRHQKRLRKRRKRKALHAIEAEVIAAYNEKNHLSTRTAS